MEELQEEIAKLEELGGMMESVREIPLRVMKGGIRVGWKVEDELERLKDARSKAQDVVVQRGMERAKGKTRLVEGERKNRKRYVVVILLISRMEFYFQKNNLLGLWKRRVEAMKRKKKINEKQKKIKIKLFKDKNWVTGPENSIEHIQQKYAFELISFELHWRML